MQQQDNKFTESVGLVSRHYRKGAFSADKGLRKLGFSPLRIWRKRIAVAASVCVVLTASACLYTWLSPSSEVAQPSPTNSSQTSTQLPQQEPLRNISQRIEFHDTPLSEVIAKIEETYNVKITNITDPEQRLTLSYEGNADELIEAINDILGTDMKITE